MASQLRALEVDVKSVRETGKGPRVRLRAGSRRGSRAAARSVAETREMCSATATRDGLRNTRPPLQPLHRWPAADLRCCAVAAGTARSAVPSSPWRVSADEPATATERAVRALRQAARPGPRVRVEQPPQADPQAHGDVREMPELQEDHHQPAHPRLRAEVRLQAAQAAHEKQQRGGRAKKRAAGPRLHRLRGQRLHARPVRRVQDRLESGRRGRIRARLAAGPAAGLTEGYDKGFPDGIAACPRDHK